MADEPRSFALDPSGSTGQFRRTHGQSPSVLKAAPQAVPQGIFLAKPEAPREGKRLAVKDLFDTAGLTTTYGSIIYAEHVPTSTAEAVRRLEDVGYANVGKTNLHEFAYGITSVNPHYGTVPNPRYPGHMAGGSSGGSAAAIAAGLAEFALGTDSGGSIRIPAACCGIVGFKPSYGLVSLEGVFPLAPSFDHAGPMAGSVGDCEEMLQELADGFEPARIDSLQDLEVGMAWLDQADPLVRARVREAAELFPHGREIDFPLAREIGPVFMREVADVHRDLFAEFADSYGDNVRTKVERCLAVTDAEYERALRARDEIAERAEHAMDGLDLVLTPTLGFVAPKLPVDDLQIRADVIKLTIPFNSLGWPALALPCGPAEDGLPASVQIAGRPGSDALVVAAGKLVEPLVRG
ncbi:MAG TPA: amidase [Gaiellaceae bacterium]|jgi:aspartyl-tRNA(Asn)/glutamyl-tRNA(Gln) amidotransferase subunit A